jgi:hypothetical protein
VPSLHAQLFLLLIGRLKINQNILKISFGQTLVGDSQLIMIRKLAGGPSAGSLRDTISMPRPTTGAYFMRMQQQKSEELNREIVRKEDMTEEEKKARKDMVRAEEALKIANRVFREEERGLVKEKSEREQQLREVLGKARAVRVEIPMEEETAAGGVREMYIIRQTKKVTKENTLGRLELFALACSQGADAHKEIQETYDAVFDQIQNEHLQAKAKTQPKTSTKRPRKN